MVALSQSLGSEDQIVPESDGENDLSQSIVAEDGQPRVSICPGSYIYNIGLCSACVGSLLGVSVLWSNAVEQC